MTEEIIDSETTMNIAASSRNHSELTVLESECWGTDDSSKLDASQKYLGQTSNFNLSFIYEEEILDSVFQACDVEERGIVPAFQIIDYLKSVTDPSRDENRLQSLSNLLDPQGQNTLVDLMTFRKTMSRWIESCWMERDEKGTTEDDIFIKDLQSTETQGTSLLNEYGGECNRNTGEITDLSIKMAELVCSNKKLTDQKTKLQRNLDLAEETNTLLAEEISDLKGKLKSSQQAVQHARSVCNELEDTKIFVTNLEDKMSVVIAQKKQLNDKLLSQNEKVKEKLDSLRMENAKLLQQLDEYENLLVQKDEILTQKIIQLEELMGLVEEQKTLLQELKNEKNDLQEELLQTHADIATHSSLSHKHPSSLLSVWSVRNEIEEIQESSSNPDLQLPDPVYRTSDCSIEMDKIDEDIWTDTETELIQLKQEVDLLLTNLHQITSSGQQATYLEEDSAILLKGLSCLTHLKCAWETYVSKINGAKKINTKNKLSLPQNTRLSTEWSLLPVNNQLAVPQRHRQRTQDGVSSGDCITWLFPEIGCLLATLLRKLSPYFSTRKLLLTIFLNILIVFMWSGGNIGPIVPTTLWLHFKLLHLEPPPM
ncbi:protein KASH5 isoform X2 [Ranitomeya variabilis]|uniref:protein KASH5 isoform X2 n=1 Tax=Ranitomeya variabilis TaxID=490064 RepID=UPI004056C6F2